MAHERVQELLRVAEHERRGAAIECEPRRRRMLGGGLLARLRRDARSARTRAAIADEWRGTT